MTIKIKHKITALSLILLSGVVSFTTMRRHSLTFDAIKYAAGGYEYLTTGKIGSDPETPPLGKILSALPVFFLNPDPPVARDGSDERGFAMGWDFFFRNKVPARRLANAARLSAVIAGMCLAVILFLIARNHFSVDAALIALVFFLADPMYRGLSASGTTDIFLALFFSAAILGLDDLTRRKKGGRRMLVPTGLAAAAGFLTKFSGLLFYPLAALMLFASLERREAVKRFAVLLGLLAAAVLVVYRGEFHRLLEGVAQQARVMREGPPLTFFWGELAHKAFPHYYLVSYVLKTPYPFLLAAAGGSYVWWTSANRRALAWVLIPTALFLLSASSSRFYATRYIFPVYPLLALCTAAAWEYGKKPGRMFLLVLAAWQVGEAAWAYPHYLPYMNYPFRREGHRYLSNSDHDWGQELPALAEYWDEEGRPPLQLCYFGTSDPKAWGVIGQELVTVPGISRSDTVLPLSPQKELLAVSAGCRQYMTVRYEDGKIVRAWEWLDARRPVRVLAGTIFVYDIRQDVPAHGRIGQLHVAQGELEKALREAQRVLEIEPHSEQGKVFLSFVRGKIDAR